MQTVTNPFQACNDIFIKPKGVFQALQEKSNWSWFPFLLVITMAILPAYLYYNFVDFAWFQELIVEAQAGDASPAEQDAMRAFITQNAMIWQSVIAGFLMPVIFSAIFALYYHLVTKSDEKNLNGFTDWYGFMWWASMPTIINGVIAVILILAASDHQLSPTVLSPLSPSYWFDVSMTSKWAGFLQGFRLDTLFSIYLTAVGITQWTSFTTKKATIVAIIPTAVLYCLFLIPVLLK